MGLQGTFGCFCLPKHFCRLPLGDQQPSLVALFSWHMCSLDQLPQLLAAHGLPALCPADVAAVTLQLHCCLETMAHSGIAHLDIKVAAAAAGAAGLSGIAEGTAFVVVRLGDLDAGARLGQRLPASTGTGPSRLFEDTSLKRMQGADGCVKVERQMDAYAVHCFTLPQLVQVAAAGMCAAGTDAGAAVIAFVDQLRQQHQDVERRHQWPGSRKVVQDSQMLLAACGSKGQAYLELMKHAGFADGRPGMRRLQPCFMGTADLPSPVTDAAAAAAAGTAAAACAAPSTAAAGAHPATAAQLKQRGLLLSHEGPGKTVSTVQWPPLGSNPEAAAAASGSPAGGLRISFLQAWRRQQQQQQQGDDALLRATLGLADAPAATASAAGQAVLAATYSSPAVRSSLEAHGGAVQPSPPAGAWSDTLPGSADAASGHVPHFSSAAAAAAAAPTSAAGLAARFTPAELRQQQRVQEPVIITGTAGSANTTLSMQLQRIISSCAAAADTHTLPGSSALSERWQQPGSMGAGRTTDSTVLSSGEAAAAGACGRCLSGGAGLAGAAARGAAAAEALGMPSMLAGALAYKTSSRPGTTSPGSGTAMDVESSLDRYQPQIDEPGDTVSDPPRSTASAKKVSLEKLYPLVDLGVAAGSRSMDPSEKGTFAYVLRSMKQQRALVLGRSVFGKAEQDVLPFSLACTMPGVRTGAAGGSDSPPAERQRQQQRQQRQGHNEDLEFYDHLHAFKIKMAVNVARRPATAAAQQVQVAHKAKLLAVAVVLRQLYGVGAAQEVDWASAGLQGLKKDKQGITQQQPGNAAVTSGTVEQVLNIAEQHKQQQQLLLRVKSEPRTDENGTWLQINT
ncbi:hypothetical protein COO60DRAFT_1644335 [Scenedesmus sp. NREL 46B-D3]|nr:hypothetical protein COO60DRAFT_1644335 [Scenedesmus sp. NREL 46B-D3]